MRKHLQGENNNEHNLLVLVYVCRNFSEGKTVCILEKIHVSAIFSYMQPMLTFTKCCDGETYLIDVSILFIYNPKKVALGEPMMAENHEKEFPTLE